MQDCRDWTLDDLEIDNFYTGVFFERSARNFMTRCMFRNRDRTTVSNAAIVYTSTSNHAGDCTGNHMDGCEIIMGNSNVRSTGTGDAITSGTATLTDAGGDLLHTQAGKLLTVTGAGVAGTDLIIKISSVQSSTQVTLEDNASTTVSGRHIRMIRAMDARTES